MPLNTTFYSNFGVGAAVQVATGTRAICKAIGGNGTDDLIYLQIHDSVGAPPNGSVPLLSIPVGIGVPESPTENNRDFFDGYALQCGSGIFAGWSSTDGTYTPVTPTVQRIEVQYV